MSVFKDIKPGRKKKPQKKWFFAPKQTQNKPVISEVKTKQKVSEIIQSAKIKAQQIILDAQSSAVDTKEHAEEWASKAEIRIFENQAELDKTATELARSQANILSRKSYLDQRQKQLEDQTKELENLGEKYFTQLQKISSTTEKEAKAELLSNLKKRIETDMSLRVKTTEDLFIEESDAYVRDVLTTTMIRGANDFHTDYASPLIKVSSKKVIDDIRGTNDCNKDFFEKIASVELVFQENGIVKINAPDSVDRELGRQTLEKLIKSKRRINPARIRRVYQQVKAEAEKVMFRAGKDLCESVGVFNLPEDVVRKLGRFKYRYSYGQNMIEHTLEETLIGISLAREFNADSNIVRLGCLFHDIGKVILDDEGTHVETGVAYLKKFNMPKEVVDCVAQSHEDEPFSSVESMIVHIADGISGARPAARHSDHEFTSRIKYLEETPLQFQGVKDAYAIQAGRELRVFVDPKVISDDEINELATKLRDKIKAELAYPGSVTVNVIREMQQSVTITT